MLGASADSLRVAVRGARDPRSRRLAAAAGFVALSVLVGSLVSDPARVRIVLALCLAALLVGIGFRSPRTLLFSLVGWLAALGLVRRLFSEISPVGSADPLLLVGPLSVITLVLAARDLGAFARRTRLSRLVIAYTLLTVLGAFNPIQGSLVAGASALIFFVPLLAFWIGRGLCDDTAFRRILVVVAGASIPAAFYGLYQIYVEFPRWDRTWIATSGYEALQVGETIRPFSAFSNAAEFVTFLAVGLMVWLTLARGIWRTVSVPVLAMLAVTIFLQSSRGIIVLIIAGLGLILAAQRGLPLVWGMATAACLLTVLPFAVGAVAPRTFGDDAQSELIAHQVGGLADPLNQESSTAEAHFSLIWVGLTSAVHEPLGQGISRVTIAGAKFGGASASTEADPSNAAVALGLPGLLVYALLLGVGFSRTYGLAAATRDPLAVAALAILTVTFLQWLNGGQYAVALLPWLALGWIDRHTGDPGQPARSTR